MSFLDLYEGDQAQTAKIQPNEGARLPTGFEQNFGAAWSDGRLFGQSIASFNARSDVLSDYLHDVKQKTGADLSEQLYPNGGEGGAPPDYDAVNARIAALKQQNPNLDLQPIDDGEVGRRAVAKAQAAHRDYEAMQAGEKGAGGSTGTFLGSAAASAADPVNILALAVAPETGGSVSILAAALKWGALAGASQAAIEASSSAFKEQVQPGYAESGEAVSNVAGAFVGGAVLGGTTRALGNAWTRVKTGAWPTSVRDAGNVIESEAHVADSNPFPGVEGEVAHREALTKTVDDILANRPVSVDQIITPDLLERSRALTDKLQAEQPMRLPVINRRAIELAAEQERLTARDTELSAHLEQLPAGDASAADRLNRLQAVEQQIAETTDPAALKKLGERKDQILVDTNPETLQAAAAPIEQRRVAEAERASIAGRLEEITAEHTRLQADQALLGIKLPPLGEAERIPTGPKGQFEMDLQPPEPVPTAAAPARLPGATVEHDGNNGYTIRSTGKDKSDMLVVSLNPDHVKIHIATVDKKSRGTGVGMALYEKAIEFAGEHEVPLRSDRAVSADAVHVWEALKRRGYDVSEGPDVRTQKDGSKFGAGYVYEVQPKQPVAAEAPKPSAAEIAAAPQPPLQTSEQMTRTLAEPAHQDAIRADIDRARAMGDVKVPHIDEQGNPTMRSVDAAMDEVDAYKAAAEQIQACANPVQEVAE